MGISAYGTGVASFNISANGELGTGGTTPIYFVTGGYNNNPTLAITAGNPGNVGIGTTSPTAPLDVYADSSATPGLLIGGGGSVTNYLSVSGGRAMYGYDAGGPGGLGNMALSAGAAKGIEFQVGGANGSYLSGNLAMYITPSGLVGIGTTGPGSPLTVIGTANLQGASGVGALEINGAGGSWFWIDNPSSHIMRFSSGPSAGTALGFVLSDSGNVGIGTTNPYYPLHVRSGLNQDLLIRPDWIGTGGNNIDSVNDANSAAVGLSFNASVYDFAGGNVGIGTTSPGNKLDVNGAMSVGYPGTAAPSNGLIVSGNVGIGTTSASTALQVNGTVTATQFSGSGAGLSNTTVPVAAINASGTASSGTYLRGDGTWASTSGIAGTPGGSNTADSVQQQRSVRRGEQLRLEQHVELPRPWHRDGERAVPYGGRCDGTGLDDKRYRLSAGCSNLHRQQQQWHDLG